MLIYFLLLLVPGLVGLVARRPGKGLAFGFFLGVVALVVGLRHKVGMDWNNYLAIHMKASLMTFSEALMSGEPGFSVLAWMSAQGGFGVYGSNLVAAIIFSVGLYVYSMRTANPWMALVGATPYLIVVVAMSASRQIIAIGVLLVVFALWEQKGVVWKAGLILMASLFHLSAAFALVFLVLESQRGMLVKIGLIGGLAFFLAMSGAVSEHLAYYAEQYMGAGEDAVDSAGALFHVLLIAAPGAWFLIYRRRWAERFGEDRVLSWMAVISLMALPAALVFSTAVDRMSLYLYPVVLSAYAGIPSLFSSRMNRAVVQVLIVLVNLLVLTIWLNYANSAFAYLPYNNALF